MSIHRTTSGRWHSNAAIDSPSGSDDNSGLPRTRTSTTIAPSEIYAGPASKTTPKSLRPLSQASKQTPDSQTSSAHHSADEAEERQTWSAAELLEVRARERTFDGAYWRTAVGLFGAALIILRVFGLDFFPVGLVFLALALGFLAIGLVRRHNLIGRSPHADEPIFVTSGGTVLLSGIMCLLAYVVLLVLLLRF
ncbi:hypothetical protein GGI25_000213 [Coemansia spiralis]|uniref:DUF202 domain-containing protein n=2 Tax=Coemansia TaxID=4863 RepID=A0A9W8GD04_9FUNG|nr:hypothetical protein EDC05_000572 [Coemansia umbellata]KAJ2625786.1 hypothetical protein GGI26_000247 [Coemansia sp. RSA 1358]KAJ2680909.1 hypothetical protein GGI25_000213 [Coemansia spiralis]